MTGLLKKTSIKTPCIGICSTVVGDTVCRGCKRFSHEVIHWNGYKTAEKQNVLDRLNLFLSQVVRAKISIVDLTQFYQSIGEQLPQVDADPYLEIYRQLCGGTLHPEQFNNVGLACSAEFVSFDARQLRNIIDDELLLLSQAHYERYMRIPSASGDV